MKPSDYPRVSIIVVNFNGLGYLKECFNSLRNIAYPNYEIILVDNCSTDGSVDFVKSVFPEVKLVLNEANFGFARANNIAAAAAEGEYLFLLNNDTKIGPEAISLLVSRMHNDCKLGILGCKMFSYNADRYFHTGIGVDIYGYPVIAKPIFYAEGSALMIRRDLFLRMGGFDEKYGCFHEDIDIAWRVWLNGYSVSALEEAVVYHQYGGTAGGKSGENGRYITTYFRRYLSERNNIRTLLKNYSLRSLLCIIPRYLLLNILEIFFFLSRLELRAAFGYLKAYAWNLANLTDTLRLRKKVQAGRVVADNEILKLMYRGSAKIKLFRQTGGPVLKTSK
jgi:GT2 family glycosyltransferase